MIQNSVQESLTSKVLPWHAQHWDRLSSQISDNTLPHALLFTGGEGVGKELFARRLAAFLLCELSIRGSAMTNRSAELSDASVKGPCGYCKQCKLFLGGTHPDFKLIEPDEGSSSIKIDQIRQLVDFFSRSSMQGGRKITILLPAEALNNNAANALLKTLEEPSKDATIILVSHQPGMLLPTIRSRCQVVDFALPAMSESLAWLHANSSNIERLECVQTDDILDTLLLAHSAPLKALNYLEEGALEEYQLMLEELSAFLKNDSLSSELATRWNDDLAVLRVSWIMLWLEQIIKLKFGECLSESHPAKKMFLYLAEKNSNLALFSLYERCFVQYKLFLGTSNPNKILAFESILHNCMSLMRKS